VPELRLLGAIWDRVHEEELPHLVSMFGPAGVGKSTVISHFASRRKRDWAIRVALGLPGTHVIGHVVRQGLVLVVIGVALGAVGTIALTRLLTSFLFGVKPVDPLAFAAASTALLVIGVVAAFVPAWRAGMVDPALALREQ